MMSQVRSTLKLEKLYLSSAKQTDAADIGFTIFLNLLNCLS